MTTAYKMYIQESSPRELYKTFTSGKVEIICFDKCELGYTRTQRLAKIKETSFTELQDWLRESKKHSIKFIK